MGTVISMALGMPSGAGASAWRVIGPTTKTPGWSAATARMMLTMPRGRLVEWKVSAVSREADSTMTPKSKTSPGLRLEKPVASAECGG